MVQFSAIKRNVPWLLATVGDARQSEKSAMSDMIVPQKPPDTQIVNRKCSECGKELPWTAEVFCWSSKCGVRQPCRSCKCIRQRAYNKLHSAEIEIRYLKAHPEGHNAHKREYQRRYRASNLEKARERNRKWRRENPEKHQKWFRENPDKVKDASRKGSKKYSQNHPDRKRIQTNRYNARKRNLPAIFSDQDWKKALDYFEGCCAVCGRPAGLWHALAMDHWIPLSDIEHCPGTIPTNIIPLCHGIDGCNNSKNNSSPLEWLNKKFGKRRAQHIASRIEAYFNSLGVTHERD